MGGAIPKVTGNGKIAATEMVKNFVVEIAHSLELLKRGGGGAASFPGPITYGEEGRDPGNGFEGRRSGTQSKWYMKWEARTTLTLVPPIFNALFSGVSFFRDILKLPWVSKGEGYPACHQEKSFPLLAWTLALVV